MNEVFKLSNSFARALNFELPFINDVVFMQKLMNDLDLNKSGTISEAEFIDGLTKNRLYRDYLAGFV